MQEEIENKIETADALAVKLLQRFNYSVSAMRSTARGLAEGNIPALLDYLGERVELGNGFYNSERAVDYVCYISWLICVSAIQHGFQSQLHVLWDLGIGYRPPVSGCHHHAIIPAT